MARKLGYFILNNWLASSIDIKTASDVFVRVLMAPKELVIQILGRKSSGVAWQEIRKLALVAGLHQAACLERLRECGIVTTTVLKT